MSSSVITRRNQCPGTGHRGCWGIHLVASLLWVDLFADAVQLVVHRITKHQLGQNHHHSKKSTRVKNSAHTTSAEVLWVVYSCRACTRASICRVGAQHRLSTGPPCEQDSCQQLHRGPTQNRDYQTNEYPVDIPKPYFCGGQNQTLH